MSNVGENYETHFCSRSFNLYFICFVLLIKSFYLKSQENSNWLLNSELSSIEYEAKHPLHAWTGVNEKIKGILVKDQNDTRIAVSANIKGKRS